MDLSVYLEVIQPVEVYTNNITHNLGKWLMKLAYTKPCGDLEEIWLQVSQGLDSPVGMGIGRVSPFYQRSTNNSTQRMVGVVMKD